MKEEQKLAVIERVLTCMPGIPAAARARMATGDSKAQAVMRAVGPCGGSHPELWMTNPKGIRVQIGEAEFWIKWAEVAAVCFAKAADKNFKPQMDTDEHRFMKKTNDAKDINDGKDESQKVVVMHGSAFGKTETALPAALVVIAAAESGLPVSIMPAAEADYEGRARGMDKAAGVRILEEISSQFQEFKLVLKSAQFSTVKAVNLARGMGQQIELFTDHQKLSQGDWVAHLAPVLPDAAWEFGKCCQALFHKYAEPLNGETAEGFKLAVAEFQSLAKQMELLPAGSHGVQSLRPAEPAKEFLTEACRLGVASKKWLAQIEAGTMPVKEFQQIRGMFLAETKPILELRAWMEKQRD